MDPVVCLAADTLTCDLPCTARENIHILPPQVQHKRVHPAKGDAAGLPRAGSGGDEIRFAKVSACLWFSVWCSYVSRYLARTLPPHGILTTPNVPTGACRSTKKPPWTSRSTSGVSRGYRPSIRTRSEQARVTVAGLSTSYATWRLRSDQQKECVVVSSFWQELMLHCKWTDNDSSLRRIKQDDDNKGSPRGSRMGNQEVTDRTNKESQD